MRKGIVWSVVVGIIALPLCYGGYVILSSFRGFLDPMGGLRIAKEYRTMKSDDLLKKIKGVHLQLDEEAVVVLTDRKDDRVIDLMLKMLNSRFERNRLIALRSLSNYQKVRIVEPVMAHVIRRRQLLQGIRFDYEYMLALNVLSKFRYEPAWPFVLEFAQAENMPVDSASRMLENYGRKTLTDIAGDRTPS